MDDIARAIRALESFQGESLTRSLSSMEGDVVGLDANAVSSLCTSRGIDDGLMASAVAIKKIAGQINVVIHAAGILCALPHILAPGEVVQSVSLGAGNTGRRFDLETNLRIAEFKFIDWQGGAESIRQNSLFKDFFELAEFETSRRKYLYVIGTSLPLRFLTGGRALSSVLSRLPGIAAMIESKYGDSIKRVCDYYRIKKDDVEIVDVSGYIGRQSHGTRDR